MKKLLLLVLCLVLLICSFLVGFEQGVRSNSDETKTKLTSACYNNLQSAISNFEDWRKTGDVKAYWRGVAGFEVFRDKMNNVRYNEESLSMHYALVCNVSYLLFSKSDECQNKMGELIHALTEITKDMYNDGSYDKLNTFYMKITE